jgi:hypothetical protein
MAPNPEEGKTTKDGVLIPSGKWKKLEGTEGRFTSRRTTGG